MSKLASEMLTVAQMLRMGEKIEFGRDASLLEQAASAIDGLSSENASLGEVLSDLRRLTRDLDVALNGDGAAKQASLCDIVSQVKSQHWKLVRSE